MPQNMNQTNTCAPTGPVTPRTAMPMPGGAPGAPATVRERLSNKMIGLVVGVSLACGLAAGVAGTAITNAINGHGAPDYSRIGAPYASSEFEEAPDFEQMPDMQQGGETGRSRGRRMPMQQQGPQDQQDENGSASSEFEEAPDFEQMPDMQQGGETGRSRGRRMPMQQQGPQDQQDENGSDSNSKSGESDSGKSSTASSDWLMEFFEIA